MARRKLLSDDSSPITFGDSSSRLGKELRKFVTPGTPFISITHQCFRELIGGLGIQNDALIPKDLVVGTNTYPLTFPWLLRLNNNVVLDSVFNNKTIKIHAGEYDLVGSVITSGGNSVGVTTLIIAGQDLKTAVLVSGLEITTIPNPTKLQITFVAAGSKKTGSKKTGSKKKK